MKAPTRGMTPEELDCGWEFHPDDLDTSRPPPENTVEGKRHWWGKWCQKNSIRFESSGGKIQVPPLLHWELDEDGFERYLIGFPSKFGEKAVKERVYNQLTARLGIGEPALSEDGNVITFVFNHSELPELIPFEQLTLPAEPTKFVVGKLNEGSECVWDLTEEPHALIVGRTGGGKSVWILSVADQALNKGYDVVLATGKGYEAEFVQLAGHPNCRVFMGCTAEDIVALEEEVRGDKQLVEDRKAELEAANASGQKVASWGAPGCSWTGRRSLLIVDEYHLLAGSDTIRGAVTYRAKAGRSLGMHVVAGTQNPAKKDFGDDLAAMDQLGFRMALGTLPSKWITQIFGDQTPKFVRDTLTKGRKIPGRGIVSGMTAPDNEFGDEMEFGVVQVGYIESPSSVSQPPTVESSEPVSTGGSLEFLEPGGTVPAVSKPTAPAAGAVDVEFAAIVERLEADPGILDSDEVDYIPARQPKTRQPKRVKIERDGFTGRQKAGMVASLFAVTVTGLGSVTVTTLARLVS